MGGFGLKEEKWVVGILYSKVLNVTSRGILPKGRPVIVVGLMGTY